MHFGNDRYRLIWEILPAEEDYAGKSDDRIIPVVVLRVGPKKDARERTIYQKPRPPRS